MARPPCWVWRKETVLASLAARLPAAGSSCVSLPLNERLRSLCFLPQTTSSSTAAVRVRTLGVLGSPLSSRQEGHGTQPLREELPGHNLFSLRADIRCRSHCTRARLKRASGAFRLHCSHCACAAKFRPCALAAQRDAVPFRGRGLGTPEPGERVRPPSGLRAGPGPRCMAARGRARPARVPPGRCRRCGRTEGRGSGGRGAAGPRRAAAALRPATRGSRRVSPWAPSAWAFRL